MMSYDKASPNAKIGCSNSNDPEFLEQLVREGKTNREIALILDLDYGSVAQILSRYGIKRDPNRPCKRCGGPIGSTNTRQLYCKECQKAMDSIRARKSSMKKAEPKKCEYCGKEYFGQPGQKYCSKQCYKDAAAAGKYKRQELDKAPGWENRHRDKGLRQNNRAPGECGLLRGTGDLAQWLDRPGLRSADNGRWSQVGDPAANKDILRL